MDENDFHYWDLLEPIWDRISIYDDAETFLRQFRVVRREIGVLFAAHWCWSEVRNGGFHQFFSNSTGVLAPEAAIGFEAIGLTDTAKIVRQAISFFGGSYLREQEQRVAILNGIPGKSRKEYDPFYDLDALFYESIHIEDNYFEKKATEYAKRLS